MTTRTLAATAAVLPADRPDRRAMLTTAGAAAVLAAIGAPAQAAADLDAALWALRTRWLAARAAIAAEEVLPLPERAAALAALSASGATIRERCEVLDRLDISCPQPAMSSEAEARQEAALEAETAAIFEIAATPARTLAGIGFKVDVSTSDQHMTPELVASIMADVVAFAAARPAAWI